MEHNWEGGSPYCSCGQDTVTCQGCGHLTCGELAKYVTGVEADRCMVRGNIGPCCFSKYGFGHTGAEA